MRSSLSLVAAAFLAAAAVSAAFENNEAKPEPAAAEGNAADATPKDEEPPIFHPEFKPSARKALFLEQFLDGWDKRWSPSEATKKSTDKDSEKTNPDLWTYRGEWVVEEATVYPGIQGDRGLVLKTAAAHHAISAPFDAPIDPAGKDLVVQYEVKLQKGLECGGAYLKLLQANETEGIHAKEFTNETPYTMMFGPDKCEHNKVHFIFRHKNPKTGEYEEKHLDPAPLVRTEKLSTLYTLVVRPDNSYEVRINNDKVSSGNLLENFQPPVNPPKEIVDPSDKKPDDWVDEAKIPDPDATKPDDWDEDAPFEIPDVDAQKPDDWYEDEPEDIPDPAAVKPEGWNDEEDGEWVPSTIPNPKCENAAGCGKWRTPMKRNPAYKGKWTPPMIDNPVYKGVWKPRMIPNPDYFEDKDPAKLSKMSGIGFELWTMQPDIMFDNIFIGDDIAEAEAFAEETWKVKYDVEKAEEKKALGHNMKMPERGDHTPGVQFTKDPKGYIENKLFSAVSKIVGLPVDDLKAQRPYILGGAVSATALMAVLGYTVLSNMRGSRRATDDAKKTDAVVPDDEEEEKQDQQRKAGPAAAGATTEAAVAADHRAKVIGSVEDATEAAVKKTEVHSGESGTAAPTIKNRASAAATSDKTADEE